MPTPTPTPTPKPKRVSTKCDVRTACFGDSQDTVIAYEQLTEKDMAYRDENRIAYNTSLAGVNCTLYYLFNDYDELYEVVYEFYNDYVVNYQGYITEFDTICDLLVEKYGEPNDTEHTGEVNMSSSLSNGDALIIGEYYKFAGWHKQNMDMLLILENESSFVFSLMFESNTIKPESNDDLSNI